jgi:hypothetical protein
MKNKILNGVLMSIKNVVLQWWILETHVSPKKFDVTKKRLEAKVYDENLHIFLWKLGYIMCSSAL